MSVAALRKGDRIRHRGQDYLVRWVYGPHKGSRRVDFQRPGGGVFQATLAEDAVVERVTHATSS